MEVVVFEKQGPCNCKPHVAERLWVHLRMILHFRAVETDEPNSMMRMVIFVLLMFFLPMLLYILIVYFGGKRHKGLAAALSPLMNSDRAVQE